jgi:hypothetical protein
MLQGDVGFADDLVRNENLGGVLLDQDGQLANG